MTMIEHAAEPARQWRGRLGVYAAGLLIALALGYLSVTLRTAAPTGSAPAPVAGREPANPAESR
jgi:uncharacterized membrane protein YedE/YeeE